MARATYWHITSETANLPLLKECSMHALRNHVTITKGIQAMGDIRRESYGDQPST